MDLQQLIKNSSDSLNSSSAETSNQNYNNDSKEEISEDGILSPNTKIQNVRNKYTPNEMEEINEESVESDITSSILSKKLLAAKQQKQNSPK
jgi:hypothetical protein